jgi:hypothetical protein
VDRYERTAYWPCGGAASLRDLFHFYAIALATNPNPTKQPGDIIACVFWAPSGPIKSMARMTPERSNIRDSYETRYPKTRIQC